MQGEDDAIISIIMHQFLTREEKGTMSSDEALELVGGKVNVPAYAVAA